MKIHIKNGRLIDPAGGIDAQKDVFIAAGRIVAVGSAPEGFAANRIIDATGLVVCPGLVDLSARLREPGFEYKATLESEMAAAAGGGVTSLACPPDTIPPWTSRAWSKCSSTAPDTRDLRMSIRSAPSPSDWPARG